MKFNCKTLFHYYKHTLVFPKRLSLGTMAHCFQKKVLIELILHFLKPVKRDPQLDSDGEAVCNGLYIKEAGLLMIEYYMLLSYQIRERIHEETLTENNFSVINSTKQCHYIFLTDAFLFSCYFSPPVPLMRRDVFSVYQKSQRSHQQMKVFCTWQGGLTGSLPC